MGVGDSEIAPPWFSGEGVRFGDSLPIQNSEFNIAVGAGDSEIAPPYKKDGTGEAGAIFKSICLRER